MKLKIINLIFYKELRDTLRDRNILISQFLLPLILYPLVVLITTGIFSSQLKRAEDSISRIYIFNGHLSPGLSDLIKTSPNIKEAFYKEPLKRLETGDLELVVFIPPDYTEDPNSSKTFQVKFSYNSTNEISLVARTRIDDILSKYNQILIEKRLKNRGISKDIINPIKMTGKTISTSKKEIGSLIGGILPFLIILFTITSGYLPALDVIVGEKERGTLETLLVSKITKKEIILGKFLAVWVTAIMSTLLHFFSSSITFITLANQVVEKMPISLTWTVFVTIIILMIPLTGFVCATIMAVIMIARSYKEGSNYLSVMTLLMFMPLSIIFSPSMKANYLTSIIPIFNISILFRDILRGDFNTGYSLVTLITNFIFSAIALWIALKLFERESILFRETVDVTLPPFLKKEKLNISGRIPSVLEAGVVLSIVFILLFYAGSYLQVKNLISGVYITQLLFIFTPSVAFLYLWKYDIKKVIKIKKFSITTFFLSIILAFSGIIFTMQISAVQNYFTPFPDAEKLLGPILAMLREKKGIMDFIIKFTMIAILPGICEETLFRGLLQSTLEKKYNGIKAIIITAAVFAVFHMNPYRFLPTFVIGLYLGYLAQKTGSIFPGMMVHMINNGLIYVMVYFVSETNPNIQWAVKEGSFLPWNIFIPGTLVFTLCIYGLTKFFKKNE